MTIFNQLIAIFWLIFLVYWLISVRGVKRNVRGRSWWYGELNRTYVSKVEPELVTTGPYAFVRHPIYSGVLLAMLGSAFVSVVIWLILFVIFCAYFVYSARVEERIMTTKFPNQYLQYKNRTKMLIPLVF
jgi:protein-S-isoprenylcysteine O-methyltransferase Ste14